MAGYEPTPEQQAILDHDRGRYARLLAGPGTGKSATVVSLILKLLDSASPPHIRLLTFTRAATAELAQKVRELPELTVDRPSTIHSFAISALLSNPGSADFPLPLRIADPWEMRNLIEPDLAAMVSVTPSVVRRKLLPEMAANWESLQLHEHPDIDEQTRTRFLAAWDQHRRIYGYTMLAELPDLLRRALEAHDDLDEVDFDMVVVDEYQDLNACDLRVLRLLADQGSVIFGVGDDEQSIYSFRRAAPEGIRRFPQDYPGSADYTLSVSHRCGSEIIRWARHVIETDPDRPTDRERLRAVHGAKPGETALLGFKSNIGEAGGVASLIRHLVNDEGLAPADILVLLRGDHNGAFSKPIKAQLGEMGISVDDPAWVKEVLDSKGNRAALLMLRLLSNREDSLAWAGLLHLEPGVGQTFRKAIYDQARAARTSFATALLAAHAQGFPGAPASAKKAKALVDSVSAWLDGHEVPDDLTDGRWGQWIIDALGSAAGVPIGDDLADLLLEVDEGVGPGVDLGRYLGQIEPLARDRAQAQAAGVRFMSMASSKGLTVEATIMVAAEENVVPRPDADEAEERRLLYVAMTRARHFQYVTWARRRTGPTARAGAPKVRERRTESRFLRHGPVQTQDGDAYIQRRWGSSAAAT